MMKAYAAILLVGIGVGCSSNTSSTSMPSSVNNPQNGDTEQGTPAPTNPGTSHPSEPSTPSASYVYYPPPWDKARKEAAEWSQYIIELQKTVLTRLKDGSEDVEDFCPNFFKMNNDERANFWAVLASGIAKFESSYNPVSRYVESTMGTDPITGRQVASEGLLQLSYQDGRSYSFCNEFTWSVDKAYTDKDPRKSIFDPKKNLKCGMQILQNQIRITGLIAPARGNYWAVLIPGGKYSSVQSIQAITRAMPACK